MSLLNWLHVHNTISYSLQMCNTNFDRIIQLQVKEHLENLGAVSQSAHTQVSISPQTTMSMMRMMRCQRRHREWSWWVLTKQFPGKERQVAEDHIHIWIVQLVFYSGAEANTQWSCSIQEGPTRWAQREDIKSKWSLSTCLLLWGWYYEVWCNATPKKSASLVHSTDVNLAPQFSVRWRGMPNRETQFRSRASAEAAAVVDWIGITSGHWVCLSTMRHKWVKPWEVGKGLTM